MVNSFFNAVAYLFGKYPELSASEFERYVGLFKGVMDRSNKVPGFWSGNTYATEDLRSSVSDAVFQNAAMSGVPLRNTPFNNQDLQLGGQGTAGITGERRGVLLLEDAMQQLNIRMPAWGPATEGIWRSVSRAWAHAAANWQRDQLIPGSDRRLVMIGGRDVVSSTSVWMQTERPALIEALGEDFKMRHIAMGTGTGSDIALSDLDERFPTVGFIGTPQADLTVYNPMLAEDYPELGRTAMTVNPFGQGSLGGGSNVSSSPLANRVFPPENSAPGQPFRQGNVGTANSLDVSGESVVATSAESAASGASVEEVAVVFV